jgi:hypothetical protein
MVTKELEKLSLTGKIRRRVKLNKENGDRGSFCTGGWLTHSQWGIEDYKEVLQTSGLLKGPVSDLLRDKPFPVVVDIMGSADTIASLFLYFPGRPKLGLAVALEDRRSARKKASDKKHGVKQIAGDILKSSTWDEIKNKLHGHKADIIFERGLAGLKCIPKDPRFCAMLLNKAWSFLVAIMELFLPEFQLA